ncbi:MAG TPA: hypothetical protein VLQ93_05965 [Myxococcaceae bacterium]|nr:hypothetical protein [Myxococcaceae bacterium]
MGYRVRTPDGELGYESLYEVERAYALGLVGPEDEVLEEGKSTWRKASSIPALARSKPSGRELGDRTQLLTILAVVALGLGALVLIFSESTNRRLLGITLALVVSALLGRVTLKAFRRPGPRRE